MECKLSQSAACAVVSRLKHDTIHLKKRSSGRFSSNADPRFTMQWPANAYKTDFNVTLRILPIELSTFSQFLKNFSNESQGLLAVGPIIEFHADDVDLSEPIKFTLPMLVQTKKQTKPMKPIVTETSASAQPISGQPSQQEIFLQQQQAIFKSMLGEG